MTDGATTSDRTRCGGGHVTMLDRPFPMSSSQAAARSMCRSFGAARAAFARTVDSLLLDTQVHEIAGTIMIKVPNPVIGDESPLADQPFRHDAAPGPHTMNGTLYAEIGALRKSGAIGRTASEVSGSASARAPTNRPSSIDQCAS